GSGATNAARNGGICAVLLCYYHRRAHAEPADRRSAFSERTGARSQLGLQGIGRRSSVERRQAASGFALTPQRRLLHLGPASAHICERGDRVTRPIGLRVTSFEYFRDV